MAETDTDIVLYGGKGGVGKTTCAAAHALARSRSGARTLVVSTDPAHSLGDAFERELGPDPTAIRDSLAAVEVDPETGQEAYRGVVEALADEFRSAGLRLDDDDLKRLFEAGLIPGGDEVAALEYVARYADADYDTVVFDTAPTGHTLRLLDLPDVLAETLGVGSRVRPLFVGLFGLHIDVAIDAVAIRVPFWQWTPPGVWFGVPLGNFVGWFLVASLFPAAWSLLGARLSRADSRGVVGLREISGGGGLEASGEGRSEASGDSPLGLVASAAVAVGSCVATILLAVAGLIVGLELWEAVTPSLTAEVIVLGTTVTLSAVAVLRAGFEPSTPDVRVTAVPVLYHVAYLGYFFWLGMYRETPALLGVGLAMLALTALLHWSGAPRVRRLLPAG